MQVPGKEVLLTKSVVVDRLVLLSESNVLLQQTVPCVIEILTWMACQFRICKSKALLRIGDAHSVWNQKLHRICTNAGVRHDAGTSRPLRPRCGSKPSQYLSPVSQRFFSGILCPGWTVLVMKSPSRNLTQNFLLNNIKLGGTNSLVDISLTKYGLILHMNCNQMATETNLNWLPRKLLNSFTLSGSVP